MKKKIKQRFLVETSSFAFAVVEPEITKIACNAQSYGIWNWAYANERRRRVWFIK